VGRVAELAGVTVRTLHHYDEIGLVQPSARTEAGYRAYSAGDVERLREVLAYRRLGFGLREIADLVGDPSTDAVAHLRRLRGLLLEQRDRAAAMVTAIDSELEARAIGIRTTPEEQLKMFGARLYDTIGSAYTTTRRTEPRIAAKIWAALGDARTVLNVGAGTGSYEPPDRDVTAVEPSAVMRAQRPEGAAPCVAAAAESLPFEHQAFDAAMAVSTVHHWQDPIAGLREMRRVARRVVVLTYDASETGWRQRFWLTRDYLPEFAGVLTGLPALAEMASSIGARTEPVLIPWDCADGFFEAYWRRPEAYLDEHVRRAVSVWTRVGPEAEHRAVRGLRDDLASGRWAELNRDLAALDAAELGLRLLVALDTPGTGPRANGRPVRAGEQVRMQQRPERAPVTPDDRRMHACCDIIHRGIVPHTDR
jgi:DNA-binding transcriptional MerR regulator